MKKDKSATKDRPVADTPPPAASESGWRLKLVVVVSGAVLMGLEMAGSRVLATHFGSSIYVWGSIIGIFLAALSGGYYLGGYVADARPSFFLLNGIVFAAGCWLLLIPFFANPLCRALVQSNLGERTGPLMATALIFGGPSVLMGIVSPFAIRLAARAVEKMGNVSGKLYALSTLGSIAGTIIVSFWLVPSLGVRTVIQSLGACLVALPFICLPRSRGLFALAAPLAVLAPAVAFVEPAAVAELRAGQRVLFEKDSAYHYVLVLDDDRLDATFLQFNNYIESGISRTPPYDTRTMYTDSFHMARIFRPQPKRILVIGGGGGIGPRRFTSDDPEAVVDLVEIDPVVADVCRKYFHVQESDRLRIHVEDGRRFVRRSQGPYDLVVLDAYTIGGQIPFHLTTREFMEEIKRVLAPGGVLLANINSSLQGIKSRVLRAEARTFAAVFDQVHVFPRPMERERDEAVPINAFQTRNVMLVAVNSPDPWPKQRIVDQARSLVLRGIATTPHFVDDANRVLESPLKTDDVPLLTDDYAPVDTMVF